MSEITTIKRDIKQIKDMLINSIEVPINEDEAARFLGMSVKTLQNYKDTKLAGTYVVNVLGQRMYYLSRLLGLNSGANAGKIE